MGSISIKERPGKITHRPNGKLDTWYPSGSGSRPKAPKPYVEPLINGIPVSKVMAGQAESHNAIFAKAQENAKKKEQNNEAEETTQIGSKPDNLTPSDAGRRGAFRGAKKKGGIPVTKHPKKVTPARDRRGKRIPGRDYDFGDGKIIREHSGGHKFPDNPSQNRGSHFNDIFGNHYDF